MPIDLGPASDHAVVDATPLTEVAWLGPYPDAGRPVGPAGPAARYEQREAVELAFAAAMQHLSGNQRAALLLFDVLGFSAAEIATMMDTSTTSVNSALARARRLLAERVPARSQQQTLRKSSATPGSARPSPPSPPPGKRRRRRPGRPAHRGRRLVDAAAGPVVPGPGRRHGLRR
jgi:hypothetical protein